MMALVVVPHFSPSPSGEGRDEGNRLQTSTSRLNSPAVLPTRNGVGPSCVSLPDHPAGVWPQVIDFLSHRFPLVSRGEIAARMQRGDVVDELGAFITPERPYQPNLKLFYYRDIPGEARIPFDETVLFEDEFLVVVDKPHFLPVTPGGRYLQETLLVRLKRKLGVDTLAPMHRIDRETAGLVLFTKQPDLRGTYQNLFSQKVVTKRYQAIAGFRVDLTFPITHRSRLIEADHFMRMREGDGEPNTETYIELLASKNGLARYGLQPLTGKKHQLRVHMAALGIPILNDQIYPQHLSKDEIESDDYSKPLQLLAEHISFADPVTGQMRTFDSQRQLEAL